MEKATFLKGKGLEGGGNLALQSVNKTKTKYMVVNGNTKDLETEEVPIEVLMNINT